MTGKYTISEMAKLFSVTKQTLRYYDKIDLYKPETVDENTGYRYYGYEQFRTLTLIKRLKELKFPLEEIKAYCAEKNVNHLGQILTEELDILHREIEALKESQKEAAALLGNIKLANSLSKEPGSGLKQVEERYCYSIDLNFQIERLYEYINIWFGSYMKLPDCSFSDCGEAVITIAKENIEQENFRIYDSIGFFINPARIGNIKKLRKIEAGTYAYTYHRGTYDTIRSTYKKLYRFIREEGCTIAGDAIEFSLISRSFTENPKEFVTEIQIPVNN